MQKDRPPFSWTCLGLNNSEFVLLRAMLTWAAVETLVHLLLWVFSIAWVLLIMDALRADWDDEDQDNQDKHHGL